MVDPVPADDRPMRSHARRNRERIIGAAREALSGTGCDTSLNEIARRAHVGIGTLFRHFPNREALLEALTFDRTVTLCRDATGLQDATHPADALVTWLRELVDHIATYRGMSASLLLAGTQGTDSGLRNSYLAIDSAATVLLQRAQMAGAVRPDMDTPSLISLVGAASWLLEQDRTQSRRAAYVMTVLTDGLMAKQHPTPTPPQPRPPHAPTQPPPTTLPTQAAPTQAAPTQAAPTQAAPTQAAAHSDPASTAAPPIDPTASPPGAPIPAAPISTSPLRMVSQHSPHQDRMRTVTEHPPGQ